MPRGDSKIVEEAKRRYKRCQDWEYQARQNFKDDMRFAEVGHLAACLGIGVAAVAVSLVSIAAFYLIRSALDERRFARQHPIIYNDMKKNGWL